MEDDLNNTATIENKFLPNILEEVKDQLDEKNQDIYADQIIDQKSAKD